MQTDPSRLEDRLGPLEPPYKSRGEAQIGRLLDRYGIPFFYEQPTLVYDAGRHHIWHPDFTLPTYGGMIVEYAGAPNALGPEYLELLQHKAAVYETNAIPAIFILPDNLAEPGRPRIIPRPIEKYSSQRYSR